MLAGSKLAVTPCGRPLAPSVILKSGVPPLTEFANELRLKLVVPPIGTARVFDNGLTKKKDGVPLVTVTESVVFVVAAPLAVSPIEYVPAATDASVVTKMRDGNG